MANYFVLVLLCTIFIQFTVEVSLEKYDFVYIPLPKSNYQKKYTVQTELKLDRPSENRDYFRVDIEDYDVPTELPDVDETDYKDRSNEFESEDLDSKVTEKINKFSSKELDSIDDVIGRYVDDDYAEDKIVGGIEVDINLYPYHVSYGTNCGGAIIAKNWVITAGHCGKKSYIRTGSKYFNQGQKISVRHSHIHPMWSASEKEHPFDYDFQLLELEEPLKFNENIQPVKIAHIEDMVIGKVITVTGWGNTEENGPYSNVLRAVRVPIISKESCQHVPFPYFRGSLTQRMFCAGFTDIKKDACQGDSGGPAVAYDRLLGMVSFGYGCATPGSFGVYSKVAKVRPWIEEVIGTKLD